MESLLQTLHDLPLADSMRKSLYLFPLIEAAHVIAIALVFSTIAVVDLRLLGVASGGRRYSRLSSELLKFTWFAFGLAVVTGSLMFISNAVIYFNNTPFRIKMILMLLAGVNMAIFQFVTERSVKQWDDRPSAPTAGKIAGILSLCFWIGVICAGRVIGFTLSGKAAEAAPPPADMNFDDFLGGDSDAPPPATPATPPTPAP